MKTRILVLVTIIMIALLCSYLGFSYAETEHFEKGDLVFRRKQVDPFDFRHTGIYCQWGPKEETLPTKELPDPELRASHRIIEAPGPFGKVWEKTYDYFYNFVPNGYRGAGTLYLTAEEREHIVNLAYERLGYKYSLVWGYKDRLISAKFFKTYRCDGLAEHCYEIALDSYGIVYDTNFTNLSPLKQQDAMVSNLEELPYINPDLINRPLGIKPRVNITNLSDDEILTGVYTLEAHADDGDYGSGIAMVEFWVGGLGSISNIIIVI